jgi:aminoglycoside 2''-phosphotransferase
MSTLPAGEPLERNLLEKLPSASQARLIPQMAEFARQLHNLPPQLVSHCGIQTLHPLTHLTSIMRRARIAIWPHLSDPLGQYYEDLLDLYTREPALCTYQPALLHGDLSPDHFLANTEQARLTGVIDFGDTCIGDPAWDLIYIYEDYGPNILKAFLNRYDPGNTPLIERKVRIYQQLNNIGYCLRMLSFGDEGEIREAMAILEEQASLGEEQSSV